MKRFLLLISLLTATLLGACAPNVSVENNVLPTLFSVTVPETRDGVITLQGRYLSDGVSGQAADSFVILGADVNGNGGVRVKANSWSQNKIEVGVPRSAGSGFVFVVVNGVRSNGLSTTLP